MKTLITIAILVLSFSFSVSASAETKKFSSSAESSQYIIDAFQKMSKLQRKTTWMTMQEKLAGQIPTESYLTIMGEVFGYDSQEYSDVENRINFEIPFGESYSVSCDDKECTVTRTL